MHPHHHRRGAHNFSVFLIVIFRWMIETPILGLDDTSVARCCCHGFLMRRFEQKMLPASWLSAATADDDDEDN